MKKDHLQLIFIIISLLLLSCDSKEGTQHIKNNPSESEVIFFRENDPAGFTSDMKLTLKAEFDECGEWGGHKEEMVIYIKPKKGFHLDYRKFSVNCDSMDAFLNAPIQKLETSKTIKLVDANKISISNYLNRMLKSKINEGFPGHAGNLFSAITSDSTLIISVYDYKKIDIESYNKLQRELGFLPTVIKKND
ncbi:hypothetical protein FCR2A7T_06920 [Flavobacterium cauense R2A-7]|uniref:Lipoprotein n=1 Tax=Flavobacterium cauense R2A-7 TaxID=1341154 RepID=V6S4C4_9FLAO|nr:hypothetical protein [Flavobacterium cauense]ESU21264.1 hypothetical protein FCR2A7T_06920 [Flavobacterium cauense R2A-7]TWI07387.1 hypothetical protein IP98_02945 [Flavobacterium cauense R2A-7]